MDPAIIAGGLKLLGGLFGSKKKSMSPQQSIMSTAAGARQAAKAYGFNALTLLKGSNATAGAGMDMGAPPLASLSILGDVVDDVWGEGKERREFNRLQNDLLSLQVQEARTLASVVPPSAISGTPALNGGRAAMVTQSPLGGDFLTEDMRDPAKPDERDNTVSYQSHGEETVVPVGPDVEELLTGLFIEAINRRKARVKRDAAEQLARGWSFGFPNQPPPVHPSFSLRDGLSSLSRSWRGKTWKRNTWDQAPQGLEFLK